MRKRCLYILVVVLCFSQCKKNKWSDLPDTTITSFAYTYPARDTAIMLDTLANTAISFSWAPATTGNYTLVFYRLLIDKAGRGFFETFVQRDFRRCGDCIERGPYAEGPEQYCRYGWDQYCGFGEATVEGCRQ